VPHLCGPFLTSFLQRSCGDCGADPAQRLTTVTLHALSYCRQLNN
jgi:hypothetical protein